MDATARAHSLYRIGALAAVAAIGGVVFDMVLSNVPGWGSDTVPATTVAWLAQFETSPWLGLRNLDVLNVLITLVSLPLYGALFAGLRPAHKRAATLGIVLVMTGSFLFVANNVGLPMLMLARRLGGANPAEHAAIVSAAGALVARGAHGSIGVLPGFLLSELGTLAFAVAMLRGRLFGRLTAWLGIAGCSALIAYTLAVTFLAVPDAMAPMLAAPGGLLMLGWQVGTARRLWFGDPSSDLRS